MSKLIATRRQSIFLSLFALLVCASAARADVKPAPLFSDHAVLQSGRPVPIWGTAAAGEKVTVTLNGQTQTATTGADGKWMVRLTDLKAGGPYEMTIAGSNTITVKDVLVGEVWLGSGQSNMQFTVSKKRRPFRRPHQRGAGDRSRQLPETPHVHGEAGHQL